MTAFADYLQTDTPCILPSIEGIHLPDDPVSWGLKIFRANPAESALQFTEVDARGEQHTQYVDEKDPANMDRFAEGITDGLVRLSVGIEDPFDLAAAVLRAMGVPADDDAVTLITQIVADVKVAKDQEFCQSLGLSAKL